LEDSVLRDAILTCVNELCSAASVETTENHVKDEDIILKSLSGKLKDLRGKIAFTRATALNNLLDSTEVRSALGRLTHSSRLVNAVEALGLSKDNLVVDEQRIGDKQRPHYEKLMSILNWA
jgi:hypothetical protein